MPLRPNLGEHPHPVRPPAAPTRSHSADDINTPRVMAANKQLPLRAQRDKPVLKYNQTGHVSIGGRGSRPSSSSSRAPVVSKPDPHIHTNQHVERNGYGGYTSGASIVASGVPSAYSSGLYSMPEGVYPVTGALGTYLALGGTDPSSVTPAHILAASIQTSLKVNGAQNPYARPLSATQITPHAHDPRMRKASVSSPPSPTPASGGANLSNTPSPTVQMNAFLRPQSSLGVDPPHKPKSHTDHHPIPHTATHRAAVEATKTVTIDPAQNQENAVSNEKGVVIPSTVTRRPPLPSPPALPVSAGVRKVSVAMVTSPSKHGAVAVIANGSKNDLQQSGLISNGVLNNANAPPAAATNHTDTKPAARGKENTGINGRLNNNTTKDGPTPPSPRRPRATAVTTASPQRVTVSGHDQQIILRSSSSSPTQSRPSSSSGSRPCVTTMVAAAAAQERPGSGQIRPGTPAAEAAQKVRNLNYNPNKPYDEVSQLNQFNTAVSAALASSIAHSHNLDNSSFNNNNKKQSTSMTDTGARKRQAQALQEKGRTVTTDLLKDGSIKKMPVTNTLTGTVFYRKDSKTEEVLHNLQQRPVTEHPLPQPKVTTATTVRRSPRVTAIKSPRGSAVARPLGSAGKKSTAARKKVARDEDTEWEDEAEANNKSKGEKTSLGAPDDEDTDDDADDFDDGHGFNDDDDDDDALDGLEDEDDDDESDTYSIKTSSSPSRQSSAGRVRSATSRISSMSLTDIRSRSSAGRVRPLSGVSGSSVKQCDPQPALLPSLFPNIPPTVNFVLDGERVEQLPWEFRKMLKWRMSPITPNVVKNCIARSGFRATKKNHDWIGYWGKHMKAPGFKSIRDYQKINHFPGSFQIGRKDRLWRNLSKMQAHFGKKEFGFFPQTFVLPFDMKMLKRVWEDGGNKQKWIIKPPASARGIGIKVINKWNQIPKKRSVIVQRYLSRPFLINESKFDLRIYVYVPSYDPLRIYVYDDGLTRFASCKYSHSMKNINNKYMHLTNYSINKKNTEYESNTDETVCQGHKWGLKALWGYMKNRGMNTSAVWESIKDLIVKTIISSESCVNSLTKSNCRRRYCCHELFGFDVMLDENLKPWIIEVNISPSLHSNSQLDMNIKGGMIRDLMNIAGFQLPDKADVTANNPPHHSDRYSPPNQLCIDRRLWPTQVAAEERSKHAYYCQRHTDEFAMASILDVLTPDDVRMLTESVDEDSRRGSFQRAFPSNTSHKYLHFFEQPRYYNLLMNAWVTKYHRNEPRGIALLETICSRGIHLDNPTDDHRHQWAAPTSTLNRDPRATYSAPSNQIKAGLPSMKGKVKSAACKSSLGLSAVTSNSVSLMQTPRPPPSSRSVSTIDPS